ncbi:hypothetical protein FRC03_010070 [Tulasnella sp. 419]|nr:hypothetical protein FRC03_010070 [Tulasnella sp. 419]
MEIDPYSNTPSFKGQRLQFSTDSPLVPSLIAANLPSSFDPATVYASRFQSKQILLENPVKESKYATTQKQKKARREKLQQRKETGVMGRNEAKRRSIWNLQKGAAKYHLFLPIHHLWLGYMAELFNLPSPPTDPSEPPTRVPSSAVIHQKLIKADYHGCIITVKDSKCTSLIGHTGIVVHETENTFKIVTIDDKFKGTHCYISNR